MKKLQIDFLKQLLFCTNAYMIQGPLWNCYDGYLPENTKAYLLELPEAKRRDVTSEKEWYFLCHKSLIILYPDEKTFVTLWYVTITLFIYDTTDDCKRVIVIRSKIRNEMFILIGFLFEMFWVETTELIMDQKTKTIIPNKWKWEMLKPKCLV